MNLEINKFGGVLVGWSLPCLFPLNLEQRMGSEICKEDIIIKPK